MTRSIIALSINTGIPMSHWEASDERTIVTAWELVKEMHDKSKGG